MIELHYPWKNATSRRLPFEAALVPFAAKSVADCGRPFVVNSVNCFPQTVDVALQDRSQFVTDLL